MFIKYKKIGFSLILFLPCIQSVSAQQKKQPVFLRKPKEYEICHPVLIDSNGTHTVSINHTDTILLDAVSQTVIQSVADSTESFWYKILVQHDCRITFEIHPSGEKNIYNFFLYKYHKDISPDEIRSLNIVPFRANLCKNEMIKDGTGLALTSAINFYDASSKTPVKNFYYTNYHVPVDAKKGEVLQLNIFHIQGTDCGYTFNLHANGQTHKFKMVYASCYREEIKNMKLQRLVNLIRPVKIPEKISVKISKPENPTLPKKEIVPEIYTATFTAQDSITGKFIHPEVIIVKPKPLSLNGIVKKNGTDTIILAKNTAYHLIFSSVGYKNRSITFETTDSIRSFTRTVYMSPYCEGEFFTMDKIYFYPNSTEMKPGAVDELEKLSDYLNAHPDICIEIQGHTNGNKRIKASYNSGFKGSSKKLSQKRAEKIKIYLTEKGIVPERLAAIGYGGNKMIYPQPRTQNEANKNIRVEILILSKKEISFTSSRR